MSNPIERIKEPAERLLDRQELLCHARAMAGAGVEAGVEGGGAGVPEDVWQRFKWLGVFYRKAAPGFYMLRLRIPNGIISSAQLEEIARLAEETGDCGVDLTTRQGIQLRGFSLDAVPAALDRLLGAGLTTLQTGMDNVRNVVGCPVAGLDPGEVLDASGVVGALNGLFLRNPDFVNLPRKFNIAVAGCREDCAHAAANDIGLAPAVRAMGAREVRGFNVLVGGALGSAPARLGSPLDVFVTPREAPWLCGLIVEIFRDHGARDGRHRARLKFLLERWGLARFREELVARAGRPLSPAGSPLTDTEGGSHLGLHPQKQAGLFYLGLAVPVGRITAAQLREVARLAAYYGKGEVRLTPDQNLILTDIPANRLPALEEEPLVRDLGGMDPPGCQVVSCTGNEHCSFALIDTKGWAGALDRHLAGVRPRAGRLRVHYSGCPHACGQHQIADIGFLGTRARVDGEIVEAVDVFLGGASGAAPRLGTKVMEKVACGRVPELVASLLAAYLEGRREAESFGDYVCRVGAAAAARAALDRVAAGVAGVAGR